jgi:ribonuclease III
MILTALEKSLNELSTKLGYVFKNTDLLRQALTHKSFHFENIEGSVGHNERLEFLGDAVLDLVLTAELMRLLPEKAEGELSKIRASLVNETVLAELAGEFAIDHHLLLGKGEKQSGGATKPRLLASCLEAIYGALFQEAGYNEASIIINKMFADRLTRLDLSVHFKDDFKTRLQEKLQGSTKQTPQYTLQGAEGPDHEKTFHVTVSVNSQVIASGSGKSKKQAEQDAARRALEVSL